VLCKWLIYKYTSLGFIQVVTASLTINYQYSFDFTVPISFTIKNDHYDETWVTLHIRLALLY